MNAITIRRNSSVRIKVPIIRDSGFGEIITYSVIGLPEGVGYKFSPEFSETLNSSETTLTLEVGLSAPLGGFRVVISGNPRPPRNKGQTGEYNPGDDYGGGGSQGSGIPIIIEEALVTDFWEVSLDISDGFAYVIKNAAGQVI